MSKSIESILIVGAGWTGRQIAAQCASHGLSVILMDKQPEVSRSAVEWACNHSIKLCSQGVWNADAGKLCRANTRSIESLDELSTPVDFALECVSEQPSAKRRALNEISKKLGMPTIIASNSSYFTPSMLSNYVDGPERFANFHFHAPIWMATVVDIVPGPQANPSIIGPLKELAIRIGQTPIVQTVENPGYIFNALLQSILTSALDLAQRGIAAPADIELAWKTVTGMQLGPFGMMDWIGIDLIHQVFTNSRWHGDYDQAQRLVDYLQPWIERGDLGVKSGLGFFQYENDNREADQYGRANNQR